MKILLSVTLLPFSVALHEDTTTPSGSGAQASDQKSKRASVSYKSSSFSKLAIPCIA